MIPDDVVDQVAHAADIVAIIGEHVRLKKTGSVYRGPCPFHQGTNANFSVVPGGGYTCFVCGEKGSVFTFVQKRLGLTFVEAVKYVVEKSGIEVVEVQRKREGPDPREPLWELNATVSAWFREMLWERDFGAPAREYIAKRSITRETADRFGMGYAPRELGLMRSYLNGLGFDDARLLECGLLVRREEQEEPRPRFRDRLIVPILDAQGHTVGFGGRLLGPGEPKYLNSAENKAFSKGHILYNLSAARTAIRRDERVVLVEGYFDVVRLVDAGIESVVAPMGTALTEHQADLLARHSKNAFLLYDSDAPGQKATFRAADVLLTRGMTVRVVTLPEGEDPDTFVAKHGRDAMEKLFASAMDVFDRKVQLLERGGWFGDLRRKRRALDAMLPTIRAASDPIMKDLYLQRAATAAGVDRSVLQRELEQVPRRSGRPGSAPDDRAHRGTSRAGERAGARGEHGVPLPPDPDEPSHEFVLERPPAHESMDELALIRVMLLDQPSVDGIVEAVARLEEGMGEHPGLDVGAPAPTGVFRDPVYAAIFSAVAAHGAATGIEALAESLDETAIRTIELLRSEPGAVIDAKATVDAALRGLHARLNEDRLAEIDRILPLAGSAEQDAMMQEKQALSSETRALDPRRGWGAVRRTRES
ncbi:MAG: DNA primase [Gemmatimonadetes bacterium]|nr:DNA primase [Gemmatimonadota bacterium]